MKFLAGLACGLGAFALYSAWRKQQMNSGAYRPFTRVVKEQIGSRLFSETDSVEDFSELASQQAPQTSEQLTG